MTISGKLPWVPFGSGLDPCCCATGPCSPNIATLYAQVTIFDPASGEAQFDDELTGGLNEGFFVSDGGLITLTWDAESSPEQWVARVSELDSDALGPVTQRCDPEGLYVGSAHTIRISFTPF